MQLVIDLNGVATKFKFIWKPLLVNRKPCYIWQYRKANRGDTDLPVIYRHVLSDNQFGNITIYVGEGSSLNGPSQYNLVKQYSNGGHGSTRVKIRSYISSRPEQGWTEILDLEQPLVNLVDESQRKFLQMTFIAVYYWKHQGFLQSSPIIPDFLNSPR